MRLPSGRSIVSSRSTTGCPPGQHLAQRRREVFQPVAVVRACFRAPARGRLAGRAAAQRVGAGVVEHDRPRRIAGDDAGRDRADQVAVALLAGAQRVVGLAALRDLVFEHAVVLRQHARAFLGRLLQFAPALGRFIERDDGLVGGGREVGQVAQHARILGIEFAVGAMADHPYRAHRAALGRPRHEQVFDHRRVEAGHRREAALAVPHEHGLIAVDYDAAWTDVESDRAAKMVREQPGRRVPAEVAVPVLFLEEADAGRTGVAQFEHQFGECPGDAVRIGGQLAGERSHRAVFRRVVGRPARTPLQFLRDEHVVHAGRGGCGWDLHRHCIARIDTPCYRKARRRGALMHCRRNQAVPRFPRLNTRRYWP